MSHHSGESHDESRQRSKGEPVEQTFTVEEVLVKLEELHTQGLLNLDAPASELVAVADANLRSARFRARDDDALAYWLVGSKGWFSHVVEEEVEK